MNQVMHKRSWGRPTSPRGSTSTGTTNGVMGNTVIRPARLMRPHRPCRGEKVGVALAVDLKSILRKDQPLLGRGDQQLAEPEEGLQR